MVQHIGVWLDFKQAFVVRIQNGQAELIKIPSLIEDGKVKGGARSNIAYGPQDKVSESRVLARRKQQIQLFLQDVLHEIEGASDFLFFGPGHMKHQLLAAAQASPKFSRHNFHLETTDNMTPNQLIAFVRSHFHISPKWQLS